MAVTRMIQATDDDRLPGTPWTPPMDPPSPDGGPPPGDGDHRKDESE